MEKIQVDILGLSSSPSAGGAYALLLKESFGIRRLPIIIGAFEAQSIALEIEGIKPPRPLTHDLFKTFTDNLGATIIEVVIDELRDNTFYAKIHIEYSSMHDQIDSRPSDAIAIAVRTSCPIFVSEKVMKAASFIPSKEDEEVEPNIESELNKMDEAVDSIDQNSETKMAALQNQLRESIDKEDYERAAKIRDEINKLKGNVN